MVLSGNLIGFICVFALLLASVALAVLDKREKNKGNLKKSRLLSRTALGLFLFAFVGGVVMTLIAGIQPRSDQDIASARGAAMEQSGAMASRPIPSFGQVDEEELRRLEEAVSKDPSDVASRERLGHLYLQKHDVKNVFRMAHEVLQMNSQSAESRAHMGMVLFSMNQIDEALRQFDLALQSDPKNLEALLHMGMVQFQGQKDLEAAKQTWQKYLENAGPEEPGRTQVEMFLKMLNSKNN